MLLGKIAFFVSLISQIIIRYPYREGQKRTNMDSQEKLLLIGLTIGGLLLPLIYIFTNILSFADYDAQNDRARRKEMLAYSGGDPTVPCIVENGEYVGSGWGNPPRG